MRKILLIFILYISVDVGHLICYTINLVKMKLLLQKTFCRNLLFACILLTSTLSHAQNCIPKFTFTPDSSGYGVQFTDQSNFNAFYWQWSFGDGLGSTLKNPHHQYLLPGKYPVCLYVVSPNQTCYGTFCDTVTVGIPPKSCQANFSFASAGGSSIQFADQSLGQANHWKWTFGDGTTSNLQNPLHSFLQGGSYTVCLSIYNSMTQCADSVCKSVFVSQPAACQADFYANVQNNGSVMFSDSSSGNILSWQWNFGDGHMSTLKNPSHQYALPGIYLVCLTAYGANPNCYSVKCDTISIPTNPSCQAYFSAKPDSANGAYFQNLSAGNYTSLQWDFGDNTLSTQNNPYHQYSQAGAYYVCLTVQDSIHACSDTYCQMVQVVSISNTCSAYFANQMLSPGTLQFYDLSQGNISNWQWDFGDGQYAYTQYPSHTFAHSGYYTVCLNVYDSMQTCSAQYCDSVFVLGSPACHAAFQYAPDSTLNSIHFLNYSQGGSMYYWNFGDGITSTHFDPHHVYAQAGQYQVCLVVMDSAKNCTDSICQIVSVINPISCKAYFYASVLGGGSVLFSNYSTGIGFSSQWNFGDGHVDHTTNPSHTYNQAGTYYVCLTIIDSVHNCIDTYCNSIYIPGPPSCHAAFQYMPDSTLNSIHFLNYSQGGSLYYWNFGDGITSTHFDPHHVYAQAGQYLVCLMVMDSAKTCTDSVCQVVTVINPIACKAYFYASVLGGGKVLFSNYSAGIGFSSHWSFGDGHVDHTTNPSHTYNQAGTYYVCLTIIDSVHNCSDTYCDSIYIANNASCQAAFQSVQDSSGLGIQFTDASSGASNYHWSFGDGTFSIQQHPHHVYLTSGTYLVCLVITNNLNTCSDTTCQTVVVQNNGPSCKAFFADTLTNSGAIYFINQSSGAVYYSWNFGDGTYSNQANPIHNYALPGTYQVCLSITNAMQTCYDIYCHAVQAGGQACKANFSYQPDSSGSVLVFTNTSVGGTSYLWSFGDGQYSNHFDPHHLYASPGYYQVCLTITDSVHACTDTHCEYLYVNGCQIGFVYQLDTIHPGNGVSFHDHSPGNNIGWYWDFGDSTFSAQKNPVHQYAQAGTYLVCMSVVAVNSICNGFYCDSITVPPYVQGVAEETQKRMHLEIYPNPFQMETHISFDLTKESQVLIEMYSVTGVLIKTLENAKLHGGNHRLTLDASSLESGLYLLKISLPDEVIISKLKIIK